MNKLVTSAATGIAQRTSRRSFLGRTGQLLLGVVGGSTLLTLMSGVAQAATAAAAIPASAGRRACAERRRGYGSTTTVRTRAAAIIGARTRSAPASPADEPKGRVS